jgi:thiamine biosynthesis protein ThiS
MRLNRGKEMSIFRGQESETRSQKSESKKHIQVVINGENREFAEGITIFEFLNELGIKPQGIAVELNLEIVPKGKYSEAVLKEGDKIEIVRMVGGG